MAPIMSQRLLEDIKMQCDEGGYLREVLQLGDGERESLLDEHLQQEASRLGIPIAVPTIADEEAYIPLRDSAITVESHRVRTASTVSRASSSTGKTSRLSDEDDHLSLGDGVERSALKRPLSFSEYDRFLAHMGPQKPSTMLNSPSIPPIPAEPPPSLFSVSTKRSISSVKSRLKTRFKLRRKKRSMDGLNCLRMIIIQASSVESKMPPRCCSQHISGHIIKLVLSSEEQQRFLKSALQYGTPWEDRIFCTNPSCGEFIPKRGKVDPRRPFEVVCQRCRTKVCSTCKGEAHALAQHCPADHELGAVLKMGENSGWRRCYNCRTLVELTQDSSHIICRCKAQLCYICGAIWDPIIGCPNFCKGEGGLEGQCVKEKARAAELGAEIAARERAELAEKFKSERRSRESEELNALRARQINERDRFNSFERKTIWLMANHHALSRIAILEKYSKLLDQMRERHVRTAAHLEDRQVAAEMDLRDIHKQSERSLKIRLKHMEAYCDSLGRSNNGPPRTVTERDLRELGQTYNVRDDLTRLHQSKINVLRDKQAKQMESFLDRQGEELDKLTARQTIDLELLEDNFKRQGEGSRKTFQARRERMQERWRMAEEIERTKLEKETGMKYAAMGTIKWKNLEPEPEEGLECPTTRQEYTYASLKETSILFGSFLRDAWAWRKGDVLALFAQNSIHTPAVTWGAHYAGGVVAPANPGYTGRELVHHLRDSGARAVVTQRSLWGAAVEAAKGAGIGRERVICVDDGFEGLVEGVRRDEKGRKKRVAVDSGDLAFLVYSSGTTGLPKGVMLTHGNVVADLCMVNSCEGELLKWDKDRVLSVLPFYHIYGLQFLVHMPVYAGITTVVMQSFDLRSFCKIIQDYKITYTYVAPPIILHLAKSDIVDEYDLSSLKTITSGAAPLTKELIHAVHDRLGTEVKQAYGLSETSPATHAQRKWNEGLGSVGPALPNQTVRFMSPDGTPVPTGTEGEIWIKGPNVFIGYHNNPTATAASITASGFFKTGDIGYEDSNGNMYITDRVKELIKYKGFQVAPAELEGILASHELINDVAVIGVQDESQATEVPMAFVVAKKGVMESRENEMRIVKWMNERVAGHKKLRGGVRWIGEVPKSASGKILRRVLKDLLKEESLKAKL
ncbi:hypothetical protein B7494_g2171 [Chlorociboria aeruginascens]|nr:hypothetical protein B7494_g2171 [Chlorociboria aeruginascens]